MVQNIEQGMYGVRGLRQSGPDDGEGEHTLGQEVCGPRTSQPRTGWAMDVWKRVVP